MKINFSAVLNDINGSAIQQDGKDMTLAFVACEALLANFPVEQPTAEEKVKRFRIALKVQAGGVQELEVNDLADLKNLIGRAFGPLVVGRAFELIEGGSE